MSIVRVLVVTALVLCAGCTLSGTVPPTGSGSSGGVRQQPVGGQNATVIRVIDGDTIDVSINGTIARVRYVGVNTPERDEACYAEATQANANLVSGQTVTLVRDQSDTDRFGRLLRFVFVGDLFVNATLVDQGFAEAVTYQPDTRFESLFQDLERGAVAGNRGCHPTGIFNDGTLTR